ncbi:MAG: Zn-dependent oligopeptidase [Elusimicrobia bacterium]|nr:Zn-dependent oligopeptidase [Elusimicrobiota bacterium]
MTLRAPFARLLLILSIAVAPAFAGTNLDFNLSAAAIAKTCADAKASAEERVSKFSASPADKVTFDNSFIAFWEIMSDLGANTSIPQFLGHVSTQKDVREAGLACDTLVSQYVVDVFTQEGPYKVLKAYAAKAGALTGEDARLVEKTLQDFKRNGLELSGEKRAKVKEIKQKLVVLQNDFAKRIAEEKTTVAFSDAELAGLPEDFLARLAKDGDKKRVSLNYPDYFPFMENAKSPESRKSLQYAFDRQGGEENVKRLAEALKLRDEAAKLLGYPTHAAYVLDERMAKTPDAVFTFLKRVQSRLQEKAKAEMAEMIALKSKEEGAKSDGKINAWDWRYYKNQVKKAKYDVDQQKIKEYFPLDVVIPGMLKVYQNLLGLSFKEITPAGAWHEDVKLYEMTDASGGEPIGYFYMDLYPREGKYKHAAAFTLVQGRLQTNGKYLKPVSAIVANFDKPTKDKPSLLPHSGSSADVETIFHEFGHIMHQTLTKAKYERFSGTSVARDFVEAPSQMLENWVWKENVLKDLSGHYKDHSKKLPKDLLLKLLAAKNADSGMHYLRQNLLATADMTYHTQPDGDPTDTWARLAKEIALVPIIPGTYPEARVGHFMGGYDAGYYGYMWSKVYAQDMFSRFEKEGVLNVSVGRDYRTKILEVGSGRDESASLRDFLGREPNEDAFLKSIGL